MTTTDSPPKHAIPIRWAELTRRLAEDSGLSAAERERFGLFCRLLAATFHYEFHAWLEELEDLYAPVDPDASTVGLANDEDEQADDAEARLFEKFAALLDRANYERLSRAEIEQAVGVASKWGLRLHVNFDVFQRLEVFVHRRAN